MSESPTHPDAPRARRRTLKVYPEYFDALESGEKSFEFRKDDREPRYAVGDTLVLREWDPMVDRDEFMGDFTGRECLRRVTYVARGRFIPEGYCVMSVVPLRPDAPRAGGETPTIDLEATLKQVDALAERLHGTVSVTARVMMADANIDWLIDALRAALLERHRDGERETVCGMRFVVDRTIPPGEIHMRQDGRVVARLINVTDGEVAVGSAPPSPERASK